MRTITRLATIAVLLTFYACQAEVVDPSSVGVTTEELVDVQLPNVLGDAAGTNEPSIAVSPTNPAIVAASSLFVLHLSQDGGQTFPIQVGAPAGPAGQVIAGDPVLAFDSQGRLFWSTLSFNTVTGGIDILVSQINPVTGAFISTTNVTTSAAVNLPATAGNGNDKAWLAVDRFVGSPFQNRLYLVWVLFPPAGATQVLATFSNNQGLTWSAPLTLSAAGEGFVWPPHVAVGANGVVHAAYHSQPGTLPAGAPNGTSGQIFYLRSINGGGAYVGKIAAIPAVAGVAPADITFNVSGSGRNLVQNVNWTQGAGQPWVVPDPVNAQTVAIVAQTDPTFNATGASSMAVSIVRSVNAGANWTAPARVDTNANNLSMFPRAAANDRFACMASAWYDNRRGLTAMGPAGNNFLLDTFMGASTNLGVTFDAGLRINELAFDPALTSPQDNRFPFPTLRMGEYASVTLDRGVAHFVFNRNAAAGNAINTDAQLACFDPACNAAGLQRGPWPSFRFCPTHQARTPFVGARVNNLNWSTNLSGPIDSSPAVAQDATIYVGSDSNNLYALNPNGTIRWTFATGGDVNSSPAIGADGTIYVGSDDNRVYAINADGTLRWSFLTLGDVRSSPAIGPTGTIYVGSDDNRLYALNQDGTLRWSYLTLNDVRTSPALSPNNSTVYFGSDDDHLYSLSASTGAFNWRRHIAFQMVDSSPAVAANGTIYIGSDDNRLHAVNPNGTLAWTFLTFADVESSPAIGEDGAIYVGSDDNLLYAINPNGTLRWTFLTFNDVKSSPAIGADGTVYVGSDDGFVYAVNPNGSQLWSRNAGFAVRSSPGISRGVVYAGSLNGSLLSIGR